MPNILAAFLSGDRETTTRLFDMFYAVLPSFAKLNHPIAQVAVTRLILDSRVKLADFPAFLESLGIKLDAGVSGQAAIVTLQMPLLHRSVRDFCEFLDAGVKDTVQELFSCLLPGDWQCFYRSVEAGLFMEQNRLDEALGAAREAYAGLTEDTANEIRFGVSVGLAELCALKSEHEESRLVLDGLQQWIRAHNTQYLLKNLAAYQEREKIWDSSRKAAEDWLKNYFVSDNAQGEFYKIYQSFTTARAYMVLSMTDQATATLEQLRQLGGDLDRPLDVAEADVLLSIVDWKLGKKKEARDRLYRTLLDLQPRGFIRVVANEGEAVLPILTAVIRKLEQEPDSRPEVCRFVKEVHVAAYERSKRFKGLTHDLELKAVTLSPKQALVLELLSKGYKNAEIVELTGLSLNTIRTHTKIAYQKLEVTNVLDAVAKARQLGILR